MSRDMVDTDYSGREHGKRRHHHHRPTLTVDSRSDYSCSKISKRNSDPSPDDRDDYPRSHHHKSKKHKHDRDARGDRDNRSDRDDREERDICRSKHRGSPKNYRIEKHHKIRIKEESLSPQPDEDNATSSLSRDNRTSNTSGRRRHESSPDMDAPKRNERNQGSNEAGGRGNRNDNRREDGRNRSNQDFRKGKKKLGAYSPSGDKFEWGKKTEGESGGPPVEKEKPNFALSGKLTEDTNMYNGVVIKYSEPLEARKPKRRWRLYPFKGDTELPVMHIHRQSAFLLGRDRKVVDIPIDHPSCSKQHAALQYRLVPYERENGTTGKRIRPYVIDLESANGTFVNNKKIEPRKYVELMERDVIKFGYSSREYVLLHESSKDDESDDE